MYGYGCRVPTTSPAGGQHRPISPTGAPPAKVQHPPIHDVQLCAGFCSSLQVVPRREVTGLTPWLCHSTPEPARYIEMRAVWSVELSSIAAPAWKMAAAFRIGPSGCLNSAFLSLTGAWLSPLNIIAITRMGSRDVQPRPPGYRRPRATRSRDIPTAH